MNIVTIRKLSLLSLILGALIGLIALLPDTTGYCLFFLMFFTSFFVILYMRKDKNYKIASTKEGTILGALIGFISTVGFFLSFSPMVCILKLIFKQNYYSFGIPDMISMGFWLFFVIVFMTSIVFALTNSITGMFLSWLLDKVDNNEDKI